MTPWIATIPVLLLAAAGSVLLLRRRRKGGVVVLAGVNVAVLVGAAVVLLTALAGEPASAASLAADTAEAEAAGVGGSALIAAAIAVAGSSIGAALHAAETDDDVRRIWAGLAGLAGVVVLTPRAAAALGPALADPRAPMTAVLPA